MRYVIVNLLRGMAIGLANIIPGVSGGTMALVLGIYESLIRAVHNIGPQTVVALFSGRKALVAQLRQIDAAFLATIAVGALGAVVATAKLLVYLLTRYHDPTYGFFFGLVLLSLIVPYRMIRRISTSTVLSALAAVGLVVGLSMAMSGEQQAESARKKAALKAAPGQPVAGSTTDQTEKMGQPQVSSDPETMLLFFVSGAVAISAMVLPGISGSFVLLLMGVYFDVLTCVIGHQWVLLGIFAAGCLLGLLLFTRFINYMLEHYHDLTMAFLLGLVVGSLYAIWPFKSFTMVAGRRVDLHHLLPTAVGVNEVATLLAALLGCAVVGLFLWIDARQRRQAGVPRPA